jgi:spore maturation protein SpmB
MAATTIRRRLFGPQTVLGLALPRAGRTILLLCKLMLPISFGVGLLRWTGALAAIGRVLAPAMAVFHLPGEAAVPLVTGYLAGIYALLGAMAMIPLEPTAVTVMGAMALVAHNLIIETTVQDRTGTPWWWMLLVRLLASLMVGLIVAWSLAAIQAHHLSGLWLRFVPSEAHTAVPTAGGLGQFLAGWGREALQLMLKIILIVTAMMIGTEWIRACGYLEKLERGVRPLLSFLGLSHTVAFAWLTAQILGVTFGGGLLIEEMKVRVIAEKDVRALHTSIGISHSLFEDTFLLAAVGASMFWIIVPRLLLAIVMVRFTRPVRWGLRRRPAVDGTP